MNIDIRKSIINNFKNNSKNDIKEAIISSMNENDEITLPGLGAVSYTHLTLPTICSV